MKMAAMVVAMAVIAGASAQGKPEGGRRVVVYFITIPAVPLGVRTPAERLSADMFAKIGVALEWRAGRPSPSEASPIFMEFVTNHPPDLRPNAVAYAMPYEGVHIRIFCDQISASQ